jgi:hypothetical protein
VIPAKPIESTTLSEVKPTVLFAPAKPTGDNIFDVNVK